MPICTAGNYSKGGFLEATGITAITGAVSTITTMVGDVFSTITGNALLCVFAAAGLLGVGISVFRRLKRAAR